MAPRLEDFETCPNESITSNENLTTTTTTRQRNAAQAPLIAREAKKEPQEIELPIVWRNVVTFSLLHLGALYGVYLAFFYAKWQTLLFGTIHI